VKRVAGSEPKVLLGATLPQFGDRERLLEGVERAESAGLDSIWVFDHLWPLSGGKNRPILEAWTTLAYLAARTDSLRIGTLVTRAGLRNPVLLAKMIETVSSVAPGRLIVAIGSGDDASRAENEAFGIPYLAGAERIGQFRNTVTVVKDWLDDAPPMWLGGRSDDVLEMAGRLADGWNGWAGTPETFARDAQQVLSYANGRRVELSWGGLGVVAKDDDEARQKLGTRDPKRYVWGGPATVAESLRSYVTAGARHLILTPAGSADFDSIELLGREVGPRLQD